MRELLIYFFNLKKSAAEAHRLLVEAYDDAALSERSCHEWFQKFKNGEFDIGDKETEGRKYTKTRNWKHYWMKIRAQNSNTKRTCIYIRSDSTNNFISFEIIRNDSKAKELGSMWELKQRNVER